MWDLRFRIWIRGWRFCFEIWGLKFEIWGLGYRSGIQGFFKISSDRHPMVSHEDFWSWDLWFWGVRFEILGFKFEVWASGFGIWVRGLRFEAWDLKALKASFLQNLLNLKNWDVEVWVTGTGVLYPLFCSFQAYRTAVLYPCFAVLRFDFGGSPGRVPTKKTEYLEVLRSFVQKWMPAA